MVVAQVTPACAFWWLLCSSSARLTSTRRRSFATDVHVRFSAIPGRSIRAGPIWPRNLVHPDEFGEKSTISRFRFGGWSRHCTCARGFLPIIGRRADTDVTEVALHLNFLEKAWISRFHFDPVHRDRPMRVALTDRPIGPRIGRNLLEIDSVRWIARAGSVRHVQFDIFTQKFGYF